MQPTSANSYEYLKLNKLNASSESLILQPRYGSGDIYPTASGIIRKQFWCSQLFWLANGLVFCTALAVLAYSVISFPTNIQCGRQLSTYCVYILADTVEPFVCLPSRLAPAPALDNVEYADIRFNGTLTAPSMYRGDPGSRLDEAWFSISRDRKHHLRCERSLHFDPLFFLISSIAGSDYGVYCFAGWKIEPVLHGQI
jgi:Mycotoxin biosynthesis protein UstYa